MLEPAAFEHSVNSYLEALSPEELRALVFRSVKRLDGAHRTQLALFLGYDVTVHPIDEVGGSALDDRELRSFIESCGLLRERYAAFLRENPRAIRALGGHTAQRMLGGEVDDTESRSRMPRIPLKTAAFIVLVLLVAFVPLAAQYAHQRGILAGLSDITITPPILAPAPPPVRADRAPAKAPQRAVAIPSQPVRHITPAHHTAANRPLVMHKTIHRRVAARPRVRPTRVARSWKFDPQYNPYFSHNWHSTHVFAAAPGRPRALARSYNGFEGRASLIVTSYLDAVIAGNTRAALLHLGLPGDANVSNVRESPIVSRDTQARVVSVKPEPDGNARVEVELTGRTGEYFEVFSVAHDGPAMRIMDRYYIPVNRTAEERAAHLLAKDGH